MNKILITDDVHELLILNLKKLHFEVTYNPDITLAETHQIIHQYDGVIINSKIIADKSFLQTGTNLRFIARLGSGLDIIDLDEAKRLNIKVISAPQGNANAVAEHALGMLLSLVNHLCRANLQVKNFHWDRELNRGIELMNRRIGIFGFGNNGSQFAHKLAGMDMEVWAYDKYKFNYAQVFPHVKEVSFDQIFDCDILSFHIPLTKETQYLIDRKFISRCRDGVLFINTSRGKILNTTDLIDALEKGKVSGACLDVFENEKPKTFSEEETKCYTKLYSFENVLVSPHVAGWTKESKKRISEIIFEKIILSNLF